MEVIMQHRNEGLMGVKTPLIDHHYNIEEEDQVEISGTRREVIIPLSSDNSDMSEVKGSSTVMDSQEMEKPATNVYFDNKEDANVGKNLEVKGLDVGIQEILTAVINAKTETTDSREQTENLQVDIVDEIDEEVIELEFERAVEKIHSHQGYEMYCPNCSNRVTKVVLRRRIVKKIPVKPDNKPLDLLGCLSCFSIFVSAGNKLNPFRMFGRDKETKSSSNSSTNSTVQQQQQTSSFSSSTQVNDMTSTTITSSTQVNDSTSTITSSTQVNDMTSTITSSTQVKGSSSTRKAYGILSLFRKGREQVDKTTTQGKTLLGSKGGDRNDVIIDINKDSDFLKVLEESRGKLGGEIEESEHQGDDVQVLVGEEQIQTGTSQIIESIIVYKLPVTVTQEPSSKSLEIVKSIVYGGLMEMIASLSVVSSGAASGVTTLNLLALGIASLVSGLVILGTNFRDMKYSESDEAVKRYKELLGRKEHFLMHALVGVISYIVFGMVPLVTYGLAFRESDNRDYKILAVAGASLLCMIILAIMKAYTRGQHKFSSYLKTVVYYITVAAMASGVGYAVGDLASKLMERLGWWDSSPVNSLFASY